MRLVELLESPRDEVRIASAWGLKKVADPKTIPAIVDLATRRTAERKQQPSNTIDLQVGHLFEACGHMRAKQAIPLMKEYIPKQTIMGEWSRGAAIWALGWIHEGTADKFLCDAFFGRLMDNSLMPPEHVIVKCQSALALARMRDKEHAQAIRQALDSPFAGGVLGLAVRWAVKELTGEEYPPLEPLQINQGVSFLDPLPK
jgi:HEAT repeat protein